MALNKKIYKAKPYNTQIIPKIKFCQFQHHMHIVSAESSSTTFLAHWGWYSPFSVPVSWARIRKERDWEVPVRGCQSSVSSIKRFLLASLSGDAWPSGSTLGFLYSQINHDAMSAQHSIKGQLVDICSTLWPAVRFHNYLLGLAGGGVLQVSNDKVVKENVQR